MTDGYVLADISSHLAPSQQVHPKPFTILPRTCPKPSCYTGRPISLSTARQVTPICARAHATSLMPCSLLSPFSAASHLISSRQRYSQFVLLFLTFCRRLIGTPSTSLPLCSWPITRCSLLFSISLDSREGKLDIHFYVSS